MDTERENSQTPSLEELRKRAEELKRRGEELNQQRAAQANDTANALESMRGKQIEMHERLEVIPGVIEGYKALVERGVTLSEEDQRLYDGLVHERQQLETQIQDINARAEIEMGLPDVGANVQERAHKEDTTRHTEQVEKELVEKYTGLAATLADELWQGYQEFKALLVQIADKRQYIGAKQNELAPAFSPLERKYGWSSWRGRTDDVIRELDAKIESFGLREFGKKRELSAFRRAYGTALAELAEAEQTHRTLQQKQPEQYHGLQHTFHGRVQKLEQDAHEEGTSKKADVHIGYAIRKAFEQRMYEHVGVRGPKGEVITSSFEYRKIIEMPNGENYKDEKFEDIEHLLWNIT